MTEENELISTVTHVLQEMTDEEICRLLQKYFGAIGKDPTLIGRMEELNANFGDSKTYVIENLDSGFNPNHAFYCVSPDETFYSFESIYNSPPVITCVIPEMEDYMVENRNSLGISKLEEVFANERKLDHKKAKTFKALQAMNDEELFGVFSLAFRRQGWKSTMGRMENFDADFDGYGMLDVFSMLNDNFNSHDVFYSFEPNRGKISSFNSIKDSDLYYERINLIADYIVESNDSLGNSTLNQILEGEK